MASSQSAICVTILSTRLSVTSTTSFGRIEASTNSCTTSCSRMKIVKSSYCDGLLEIFNRRLRASSNDSGFR